MIETSNDSVFKNDAKHSPNKGVKFTSSAMSHAVFLKIFIHDPNILRNFWKMLYFFNEICAGVQVCFYTHTNRFVLYVFV